MAAGTLITELHALWAADNTLCALLPAARVFTGRVPAPDSATMPYARIEQPGGARGIRTNESIYPEVSIVFHVWSDDFDTADAIRKAIEQVYQNQEFDYDAGSVKDLRYNSHTSRQPDLPTYTAWETLVSYTAKCCQTRAR